VQVWLADAEFAEFLGRGLNDHCRNCLVQKQVLLLGGITPSVDGSKVYKLLLDMLKPGRDISHLRAAFVADMSLLVATRKAVSLGRREANKVANQSRRVAVYLSLLYSQLAGTVRSEVRYERSSAACFHTAYDC
jgi:hypothetical protein